MITVHTSFLSFPPLPLFPWVGGFGRKGRTNMQQNGDIPVAGPRNNARLEEDVRHVKTLIAIRERIADAARNALPPHVRRPLKGTGRWPRRIRIDLLRL